jgi:hypothetical protein
LELRDGDRIVWPESQLPHSAPLTIQDRHCFLTATVAGSQVRIEVTEQKQQPAASAGQ